MEEFDRLWKEFDENEIDENCSKMTIVNKLEPLAGEKTEKIELELKAVYLIHALYNVFSHIEKIKTEEIDRCIQLFLPTRNAKEISYFTSRLQETKSHQNRWRYALICFLLTKKPQYASDTINNLLECSRIHLKQKEVQSCVHLLVVAFNINKLYNLKYGDDISKAALHICFDLENTEHERWLIEPTEVFCLLNNKAEKETIARLITIIHKAAKRFSDKKNSHLQRSLLNASLGLCNLTDLSPDEKQKLRRQIQLMVAESNETDGNAAFKENNGLAATKWYEEAQQVYQKLGMSEKVKELGEKIRESTKVIQWKTVSTTIELPPLEFEGETGIELVRSISRCEMVPNQSHVEQVAKDIMADNPISHIWPTTHYNRRNPISHTDDYESRLRSEIKRQTLQQIKLAEHWLATAVKKLEEQKRISEEHFTKFISDSGLHDKDSLEFLRSGIKHHFNQDYVASIHILIPQVENTLRLLLNSRGISTIKVEGKEMRIMDSPMGSILENDGVVKTLGNDLTSYLKIKFTDIEGINLRNYVAHGLLPLEEFNHVTSISIIYVIIILTRMSVEKL